MSDRSAPDYYELLHVQRDADDRAIKKAYRALVMQVHPDKGGTAGLFGLVEEAYSVLSDPQLRAAYDAAVSSPAAEPSHATSSGGGQGESGGHDDPVQQRFVPQDPPATVADSVAASPLKKLASRFDRIARVALVGTFVGLLLIDVVTGPRFTVAPDDTDNPLPILTMVAFIALLASSSAWIAHRVSPRAESGWTTYLCWAGGVAGGLVVAELLFVTLFVPAVSLLLLLLVLSIFWEWPRAVLRWIFRIQPPGPALGEVWYADFPFDEDDGSSKDRPCLVLGKVVDGTYRVCKVTSTDLSDRPGYHVFPKEVSGLDHLSYIRVSPTNDLPHGAFRRLVGDCSPEYALWVLAAAE